jgi:Ni/Co efflux regulator RcnB
MKKLFTLSLLFASLMFTAVFAEAAAPATNSQPQRWERDQRQTRRAQPQRNSRYNRRGVRVVNRTRIVRIGRQRFRETIQIRYLPNGRTQTRILSRVRIR